MFTEAEVRSLYRAVLTTELFGPALGSASKTLAAEFVGRAASIGATSEQSSVPLLASTAHGGQQMYLPKHDRRSCGAPCLPPLQIKKKIFTFFCPSKRSHEECSLLAAGPIKSLATQSCRMLLHPLIHPSTYSIVPFKVLDSPELRDDVYDNVVSWGPINVIMVGLGRELYSWSAHTGKVMKHHTSSAKITAVSLATAPRATLVAAADEKGSVTLIEAETQTVVRALQGHQTRVNALSWNAFNLASASHDGTICLYDVRLPNAKVHQLRGHVAAVCSLAWSPTLNLLASSGAGKEIIVFDKRNTRVPLWKLKGHSSVVKGLAWNPHAPEILVSGGGWRDCTLRFHSTATGSLLRSIDTGSEVSCASIVIAAADLRLPDLQFAV